MSTEIYILVLTLSHLAAVCVGYRIMWKKAGKWDYQFKRYGTSHFNWKEEEYHPLGECNTTSELETIVENKSAINDGATSLPKTPTKTNVEEVKCLNIKYSQRQRLWELLKDHQHIITIGSKTPYDTLFEFGLWPHAYISDDGKLTVFAQCILFDSELHLGEYIVEMKTVEFDEFFERIKRLIE